jgi:hypothetical protein
MQETPHQPESASGAPQQLHHLRELVGRRDADAFARELNLDPEETRRWFERGFGEDGYGVVVAKALGLLVLRRMVAAPHHGESKAHG